MTYMFSEGFAAINGTAIFKYCPPEYGVAVCPLGSESGGTKSDGAGRAQSGPSEVDPVDKTKTEKTYFITTPI